MEVDHQAKREYATLLRMHERLVIQLQGIRDELVSPATKQLLKEIRNRTGNSPTSHIQEISAHVEESIRALKLSESNIQQEVLDDRVDTTIEGVPNLPPHLARFLAERVPLANFSYEVDQDEVRGWIIRWKEYTHRGTVRGYT